MINKGKIEATISATDKLYSEYTRGIRPLYFCKLAIIEVCGWIEESMDAIVLEYAAAHLQQPVNLSKNKKLVKDTYSFEYYAHFRMLLMHLIGIINLEIIESKYDQVKFERMCSALDILKHRRNDQAHTYIKGTTMTIDTPSVTKANFDMVYSGLKDIEKCIRNL